LIPANSGVRAADLFTDDLKGLLLSQVHAAVKVLMDKLNPTAGAAVDTDIDILVADLQPFYRHIATFFSYATPLLSHFWKTEDDEDDEDEDFDDSDDEMWQEYEPADLVDKLTGPDNVEVDEVSTVFRNMSNATCSVGGHALLHMRRLNGCIHVYCSDCLDKQLHSRYNTRYKCAQCRASLLQ